MAPKTDPSPAKLAAILSFFHSPPLTAYTLPQLEKLLPPACPGVSSMIIKDLLTHLVGNSQLNAEKIGSGNWYWHFPSAEGEAVKARLDGVRREVEALREGVERAKAEVEVGGGVLEVEEERVGLQRVLEGLEAEEGRLRGGGEAMVGEMKRERDVWEERVVVMEDNINILLAHLKKLDTPEEAIEQVRGLVDILDLE